MLNGLQNQLIRVTSPDSMLPGMVNVIQLAKTGVNLGQSVAQVITLTIAAQVATTEYKIAINGREIKYRATSTSIGDSRALLMAALSVVPEVSGVFDIALFSTNRIVLTARQRGINYTFGSAEATIVAAQTTTASASPEIPAGRVVVRTGGFSDNVPIVALPTLATQQAYGVGLRSHGGYGRNLGETADMIENGQVMTVLAKGQVPMEFEAMVDTSVLGTLCYRAVPSAGFPETGKLLFAVGATPADCVALPGCTLDSPIGLCNNGKYVAMVTIDL